MTGIYRPYNVPFSIVGVSDDAKGDLRLVGFPAFAQIFSDARTLTNADGQNSAGGWVQCASMTNTPLMKKLAYAGHNIVRCHSGRFIDIENPIHVSLPVQILFLFNLLLQGCYH